MNVQNHTWFHTYTEIMTTTVIILQDISTPYWYIGNCAKKIERMTRLLKIILTFSNAKGETALQRWKWQGKAYSGRGQ